MRELTFVAPRQFEYRERAAPELAGPGEALVRPLAVARCDLDLAIAKGHAPVPGPFPLGHECVAEVVAVGEYVTGAREGMRVVVPFQISCGACRRCVRGQTGSCVAVPRNAAYGLGALGGGDVFGGAMSDVLRVPYADAMLVALPPGLDPVAAAALSDNAVDGFRTVHEPLAREPGAPVLVVGGGAPSVGLYAVAAARALGASEVVYVDPSPTNAAVAAELGARVVVEPLDRGRRLGRFPITVDASSREEGLRFAIASTDVGGTCTSVGVYFGDVPMPLLAMYTRGIRFVTSRIDARRDLPAAAALAATGAFALTPVATTVVPWDEAPRLWGEPAPKLVFTR